MRKKNFYRLFVFALVVAAGVSACDTFFIEDGYASGSAVAGSSGASSGGGGEDGIGTFFYSGQANQVCFPCAGGGGGGSFLAQDGSRFKAAVQTGFRFESIVFFAFFKN